MQRSGTVHHKAWFLWCFQIVVCNLFVKMPFSCLIIDYHAEIFFTAENVEGEDCVLLRSANFPLQDKFLFLSSLAFSGFQVFKSSFFFSCVSDHIR